MKYICLITSILIFLFGCSTSQKVDINDANQKIYDLTYDGIGIDVGATRQETFKLLGEPVKVEKTLIKNKYYEFNDEITTYFFQGLEVLYYKHNHPEFGWDKVARVEVSGNDYDLKYGIKIGMSASEICRKFGKSSYPPHKNEVTGAESFFYIPKDATHEQVIFVIRNRKLEKFIWSYMPD